MYKTGSGQELNGLVEKTKPWEPENISTNSYTLEDLHKSVDELNSFVYEVSGRLCGWQAEVACSNEDKAQTNGRFDEMKSRYRDMIMLIRNIRYEVERIQQNCP